MEELGHQFFVYVDAQTEHVQILYRRQDGDYGMIEPVVAGEYTTGRGRGKTGSNGRHQPERLRRQSVSGESSSAVDPGLTGHQPTIDEVPAQRGDVRVEQREPHVDLALLVVAVLREGALEDDRQEEVALARLGRDRHEAAVPEERPDDLLLLRQAALSGTDRPGPRGAGAEPRERAPADRSCGDRSRRTAATMDVDAVPTDDASASTSHSPTAWSRRPTGRSRSARRRSRSSATTRPPGSVAARPHRRSRRFRVVSRPPASICSRSTRSYLINLAGSVPDLPRAVRGAVDGRGSGRPPVRGARSSTSISGRMAAKASPRASSGS